MARTKIKWKFSFFFYLILVNVCIKSLPLSTRLLPTLTTSDTIFQHNDAPHIDIAADDFQSQIIRTKDQNDTFQITDSTNVHSNSTRIPDGNSTEAQNRNTFVRQVRPGQRVRQYILQLAANGDTFSGIAVITVDLELEAREDPIVFHAENLNVESVEAAIFNIAQAVPVDFSIDDGLLEIYPTPVASSYILVIEYTGSLSRVGQGFYRGSFQDVDYLAMNLHPTHARRVFPCMDEPTASSTISFTFNGFEYNHVMTNSLRDDTNFPNQFRALQGPPHRWAMAAHNLNNINVPTTGVFLYIRPGISNQESQASVALNYFYNNLVEWTEKPYFEIINNQADQLSILALPDVSRDWYGLSTVAIWEPHVLMENTCSSKQRYTALQKMSVAMARQWFGQVIFPENWRYEWVVAGLASYAGFDILREFQTDETGLDISMLDVNTLFVTEVIQESLYRDSYSSASTLELGNNIFGEDEIRDYIAGIQKVKAPALFRMLRLILGDDENDFIKLAGRSLISRHTDAQQPGQETVNLLNLVDAINSHWIHSGNGRIGDVAEYLEPWLQNNGCPLIHVATRQGGVLVTQERIGFSSLPHRTYNIPVTYTVNTEANYDNIYPIEMVEGTWTFDMFLDDEDEQNYVLFNIQGQGYYRVNYDNNLWGRITGALEDPDRREEIHPLNRATLVDDALNLARGGRIGYDIAFPVIMTMEHETEYAPWRAFVRNMNFIRKRLIAYVFDNEDLDQDIYLRMVRRTIVTFEREIGFTPDPQVTESAMTSLTRGLVMDHACRAGYDPCIAAAIDWFYDPDSSEDVVNPNIPSDIRPAVYCTMVREGGDDAINALYARLDDEVSMWERVVILESLTCSTDTAFVRTLLEETIAVNSRYSTEERVKIFIAAAESSYENARVALSFISQRINEIRAMYGGPERLEELINALTDNMGDEDLSNDFVVWVYAQNNNLDDSQFMAEKAADVVSQNREWDTRYREVVYEWIDENDAPTLLVSLFLISLSCIIGLLNH